MVQWKYILTVIGGFAFALPLVHADTLQLKDGQIIYGTISGETSTAVTIDASNGRFTFPREKVLVIKKESPLRNEVRQMENLLSQGNLNAALAFYKTSSLSKMLPAAELNSSLLRNLDKAAGTLAATSETAALLADHLQMTVEPPAELLLLAAAACMDCGNTDVAANLLRKLELKLPSHLNWPPDTVVLLLERIVNASLALKDGAVLATVTELAAKLPVPSASKTSTHLRLYSQLQEKIRNKEYLAAAAAFTPDLFLHRADLFVPLAERLIWATIAAPPSADTQAALQSARVNILPYIDNRVTEEALKVLVKRLLADGREREAQQVIYATADKNPDVAALLQHLLDLQQLKAQLSPDSPMEAYKLAAWARNMGLLDEARSLFVSLRKDARFAEAVTLQLQIIEHAQAEQTVTRLRRLFDTDDLERLQAESAVFLETSPPDTYAQQTRDLIQLANFQSWSTQRSSFRKAEAEYQQAERLANRREFDQALMHLNRVQLDRKDSAAAAKAVVLRDKIMLEKLKETRKKTPVNPQN